MEERIRVPGAIASAPDEELNLDELDQVAGGLARAWSGEDGATQPVSTPGIPTPIRG